MTNDVVIKRILCGLRTREITLMHKSVEQIEFIATFTHSLFAIEKDLD